MIVVETMAEKTASVMMPETWLGRTRLQRKCSSSQKQRPQARMPATGPPALEGLEKVCCVLRVRCAGVLKLRLDMKTFGCLGEKNSCQIEPDVCAAEPAANEHRTRPGVVLVV